MGGKYLTSAHEKGLLSHSFDAVLHSWEEHFKTEEAITLNSTLCKMVSTCLSYERNREGKDFFFFHFIF